MTASSYDHSENVNTCISIIIPLVILCMPTVRPVIFGICEIATMSFELIPCDTDE